MGRKVDVVDRLLVEVAIYLMQENLVLPLNRIDSFDW